MSEDQSILVKRLEALEKENRRIKGIGGAVIVIAASLLLMGQARTSRRVEANQFVLVDSNGKARSMWTVESGRAELEFYDNAGIIAASMASSSGGAYIYLLGKNGASSFDATHLGMASNGKGEMDLTISDAPSIRLTGKDGKVIWKAP
jgi:hypothetical protein